MANFGAFLLGLAGPLARRVMLSLGLGVISYAGLLAVASQVSSQITAKYSTLSGSVLDLLNLIGFGQAVGIIIGAVIARAAFGAISKIGAMSA